MSDYEDYENNLAFPPAGDWSDSRVLKTTDRTESTLELVNMYERINRKLVIAETALRVMAKHGNELAKLALEEMANGKAE